MPAGRRLADSDDRQSFRQRLERDLLLPANIHAEYDAKLGIVMLCDAF
jgi:hypothetical protein